MKLKYRLEWLYWKCIYQHILAKKIYDLSRPKFSNPELPKLLATWRRLRTKYDGAEFDNKGYWVH